MTHVHHAPTQGSVIIEHKLAAAAWGLFFVWVGVALFAGIGWGVGLLGIGVITLGAQGARRYFALPIEGLWIVVGALFVLGGVWELLGVRFSLVPVVLIVAGGALLLSSIRRSGT